MSSSLPASTSERKLLGAWYTPDDLVDPMARWAIRSRNDSVLDPSCGDGAFLCGAARRLAAFGGEGSEIVGIDVSSSACEVSRSRLAKFSRVAARTETVDFLELDAPTATLFGGRRRFDVVMGNPPYVRFQLFAGASRGVSRAAEQGVRLSRLASSWAAFVVHACAFLNDGGRLALVLPEELVQCGYAGAVRKFLRRRFAVTTVVAFARHVFPDSQERVVLVLAEGEAHAARRGALRLARLGDVDELERAVARGFPGAVEFASEAEPVKWEVDADDDGGRIVERLIADGSLVRLDAFAKAGIGFVSGANDYFVLRPSEVAARKLPRRFFRSALVAARQMPGAIVDDAHLETLRAADDPCLLWSGKGLEHEAVDAYRLEGERLGIDHRYKCRVRSPWFVVPGVKRPDALLTYMSDVAPRLSLNRAGVACTNNLHAMSLTDLPDALHAPFVAAFHNSATASAAERVGRRYGGGVLKLEPSEADALPVPAPSVVRRIKKPAALLREVDRLLRLGRHEDALDVVDGAVLMQTLGLSVADKEAIGESRRRRRQVRLGGRLAVKERRRGSDGQVEQAGLR